jgi:hypothetical protein
MTASSLWFLFLGRPTIAGVDVVDRKIGGRGFVAVDFHDVYGGSV